MRNTVYDSITDFVDGISFPKSILNSSVTAGNTIEEDEFCRAYQKIIHSSLQKKNKKRQKRLTEISVMDIAVKVNFLNEKEKYRLFVLICFYCYYAPLKENLEDHHKELKILSEILGVRRNAYEATLRFFSSSQVFGEGENCIYLTAMKMNPLIIARGVNWHKEKLLGNEILCMRYIPEYDLFLCKTYQCERKINLLSEHSFVREFNIADASNFGSLEIAEHDFNRCRSLIRNFNPFTAIRVAAGENTPEVELDPELSLIKISGHSTPLSPTNYFEAIFDWLGNFERRGKQHLDIHFHFDYYNTYTSKFLLRLLAKCRELEKNGRQIRIYWCYQEGDDEIREFGEQLQEVFKIKLGLTPVKNFTEKTHE